MLHNIGLFLKKQEQINKLYLDSLISYIKQFNSNKENIKNCFSLKIKKFNKFDVPKIDFYYDTKIGFNVSTIYKIFEDLCSNIYFNVDDFYENGIIHPEHFRLKAIEFRQKRKTLKSWIRVDKLKFFLGKLKTFKKNRKKGM